MSFDWSVCCAVMKHSDFAAWHCLYPWVVHQPYPLVSMCKVTVRCSVALFSLFQNCTSYTGESGPFIAQRQQKLHKLFPIWSQLSWSSSFTHVLDKHCITCFQHNPARVVFILLPSLAGHSQYSLGKFLRQSCRPLTYMKHFSTSSHNLNRN